MSQSAKAPPKPGLLLIVLAYVGFVSLGLPDAVIGVAWPSVRDAFGVHQSALGLVLVASACGYFLSSFFSGRLIHTLGIGLLLTASTALVAASGFGFALAPVWVAFVACAVLHGLGSGAIDAGLNGYAAAHLPARHVNWLHACYCLGAMIGPLMMTGVLNAGRPYSLGYVSIGAALLALSVVFALTRPLWGQGPTPAEGGGPVGTRAALGHAAVWLQIGVFFLYTGLEVTIGQWTFTVLTESREVAPAVAGTWVSAYWGSIGVGRVLFGFVVEWVAIDLLLRGCLLAAVAGAALIAVPGPAWWAFAGLVVVGFALAPVYPCLMTRTPQRLGPAVAAHAVGFQVGAAMIGAAVVPGAVGLAAEGYGLETVAPAAVGLAGLLWLLHEVLLRTTRR
jgi:fucose permease